MPSRARAKSATEQPFHILAAEYLALALPSHTVWTTFPSGGGGKIRGAFLKKMGLMAGWPDIQILVRSAAYDSARPFSRFIGLECKRAKGGIVSASQIAAHHLIRNAGGEVYVVRSLDDIYDTLFNMEKLNLKAKPSIAPSGTAARNAGLRK